MKIFLDDVRVPSDVYENGGDWITERNIEPIKDYLTNGWVEVLSLDGDMGQIDDKDIPGGVELCDWMAEHNCWPTQAVLVHSQNPVKRQRMIQVINRFFVPIGERE